MKNMNVTDIVNVYYNEPENWKRSARKPRACNAMVFFTEGEIEYFFAEERVVAKQGDVLLLPQDLPYSGKRVSDKNAYFVLDFHTAQGDEFHALGAPAVKRARNAQELTAEFMEILSCWQEQQGDAILQIKSFLYQQLAAFFSGEEASFAKKGENDVIAYIQNHYCESTLNVSHLCAKFFISESQLRRNIKKLTGVSPNEYITMLRINQAKSKLMQGKDSVKNIAFACGFESPYYFSRCFSKHVGVSPKDFIRHFKII